MKTLRTAVLALSFVVSIASFASTWDVDGAHASANFAVKHLGISTVNGTLGKVSGKVELDEKDLTKSKVDATVDVVGLSTQMSKRDDHLRSPDFFDTQKFPSLTFKSKKWEKTGANWKVTGDLTLHGVTKEVALDVEVSEAVAEPFQGNMVRSVKATTTIDRTDFGLTWNKTLANNSFLVGKEIKVSIDAEIVKAKAAPAKM